MVSETAPRFCCFLGGFLRAIFCTQGTRLPRVIRLFYGLSHEGGRDFQIALGFEPPTPRVRCIAPLTTTPPLHPQVHSSIHMDKLLFCSSLQYNRKPVILASYPLIILTEQMLIIKIALGKEENISVYTDYQYNQIIIVSRLSMMLYLTNDYYV